MWVQRSVRNERIPPPEAGPTKSRERATCSKSLALVSVATLSGWSLGEEEWCSQCIGSLFLFFRAEGYMGSAW